jgi:large subunit ribosomal protein L4
MASLPIYDKRGNEVGKYDIDAAELAPKINKQLLHDAVVMYQANLRQGTFRTKSRSEVAGTTKKMYRQKGTGNARAGSRRSGVRRGGNHIHAKRPRDFGYRLPRKALQAATRMAIASKVQDDQLVVIDELAFTAPKTSEMAAILKALGLAGQSTLVAVDAYDVNVYKSARNIDRVSIAPVAELNALAVLAPNRMLITRAALDAVKAKAPRAGAAESATGEN